MNIITVRQAVFAELEALVPLFDGYRQFYGKSSDFTAERLFLSKRFNHGESVIFIAERAEKSVGFTQLYPSFSSVSLARVFILNDLFVHENTRRSGVASKLLKAATSYARAVGAVRLSLNTVISNEVAQGLYEAQGWKRDSQFYAYHQAISG